MIIPKLPSIETYMTVMFAKTLLSQLYPDNEVCGVWTPSELAVSSPVCSLT